MFKSDLDRIYREEQHKDYVRESQRPGVDELPRPERGKGERYNTIILLSVVVLLATGFLLVAGNF